MTRATHRIYLEVPWAHRRYVKELGAEFDFAHGHYWIKSSNKDFRLHRYITPQAQIPKKTKSSDERGKEQVVPRHDSRRTPHTKASSTFN